MLDFKPRRYRIEASTQTGVHKMIYTKETLTVGTEFVKLVLNLDHPTGVVTVQESFRGWISDRFFEDTISMGNLERVSVVMDHSKIYETDMDLSAVSCENDPFAISVSPDGVEFYMDPKNFPNEALGKFYTQHFPQKENVVKYGPARIIENANTGFNIKI